MIFVPRKHKTSRGNGRQEGFWPEISKEEQYPPNSKWTIKCLKSNSQLHKYHIYSLLVEKKKKKM